MMTNEEREAIIAELDQLLGPPDGSPLNLTVEQSQRVRFLQHKLDETNQE